MSTIDVYSITTFGDSISTETSEAIKIGQYFAARDIESNYWNHNLLSDYLLNLVTLQSNGDVQTAMKHAIFESIQSICRDGAITSPIFLGCPWSSLSKITSEVFDIFPALQISSSATAGILSKKESFLRLIASDTLQATALIQLCVEYGWDKVGVIYIDDAYGDGLKTSIAEQALDHEILVQSWAYDENTPDSITKAAEFIKANKLYINILIVHDVHIKQFFQTLNNHQLVGYPYFYLGTDSWFVEAEINGNDIMDYVEGYIGTIPGSLSMLTENQYRDLFKLDNDGDMTLYWKTMEKHQRIAQLTHKDYGIYNHHNLLNFGYDAMYAEAFALDIFNKNYDYSLDSMFDNCSDVGLWNLEDLPNKLKPVRDIFHDILIHNVSFIGATGPVSFDDYGDREGGLFLYGYITSNKTMKIFGGHQSGDQSFIGDNEWPSDFNGNIPKSYYESDHIINGDLWSSDNMALWASLGGFIICCSAWFCILLLKMCVGHSHSNQNMDDSDNDHLHQQDEQLYVMANTSENNEETQYEDEDDTVSLHTVTADTNKTKTDTSSLNVSGNFSHDDTCEMVDILVIDKE